MKVYSLGYVGSFVLLCSCCLIALCGSAAGRSNSTSSVDTCNFRTQRVQCGDYACDASTHVCITCDKDAQCYPAAMECDVSTGKCEVKSFGRILNFTSILALIGAFAVCAIGVIAGVGGGGILVPMFTPMMKLPMMSAVALSQSTICGQTTLNVYLSLPLKHPDASWDRPLINYQYLGLLLPLGLIGTLIGSILNNICSDFLRLLLLFVLLTAVLIRTIIKTRRQFAADKQTVRVTNASEGADGSTHEMQKIKPGTQNYKATKQSNASELTTSAGVDESVSSSLPPPRPAMPQYPVLEITMFISCFSLLLFFNVTRSYTTCGSVMWWIYVIVPIIYLSSMFYYHYSRLAALAAEEPDALTFKWNRNTSLVFPLAAVVAGAAASMLGIGGGLVLGFVMYEVGLAPEETSITGGTATFFIAFSSGLQLFFTGNLQLDSGLVGFLIGMASTGLGQLVLMKYIREHGLRFLIVASLALIVGGSLLILGGVGIVEAVETIRSGGSIFSMGRLCHKKVEIVK